MKNLITNLYTGNANKALLGTAIGLFAAYSFFIVTTVVAINQRKNANDALTATQSQVSNLEIQYFNLDSSITMDKATAMGFVNSDTPTFAYLTPQPEQVAMNAR